VRTPFPLIISVLLAVALAAAGCSRGGDAAANRTDATAATPTAATHGFAGVLARNGIAVPARGKFILVNIPAFELIALEDGTVVLHSRIVVGRPATPTPEMLSSLYAVKFNPSWTPTPAMVRVEGARWAPPGPRNPLGQILFELDNDELIFLHDTNDRSFFDRAQRALSHGCVRVQQARALAAWALGVSETEVAAMVAAGATRVLPLAAPIPVSLAYHTRFPDEQGVVRTYPDIYGRTPTAHLHRDDARPSRACAITDPPA
jgi:murein L,D-transpeptidase YcbB/YkuD